MSSAPSTKRRTSTSILHLIQFDPKLEPKIIEALFDKANSITSVKPGQYIVTKEDAEYLQKIGVSYKTLADLDYQNRDVLRWYKSTD